MLILLLIVSLFVFFNICVDTIFVSRIKIQAFASTVKPVLSGPKIKRTPFIKRTLAWVF